MKGNGCSLMDTFDAALPALTPFGPGAVPAAGLKELEARERGRDQTRQDVKLFGGGAAVLGTVTWMIWPLGPPSLILTIALLSTFACGGAALGNFLHLAFGMRAENALPAGSDVRTAKLEDGLHKAVRAWNLLAFGWNRRRDKLRTELSGWQVLRDLPEARDLEWDGDGLRIRGEALLDAMKALAAERALLMDRRHDIARWIGRLEGRLLELRDAETLPALPAGDAGLTDG